MQENIPTDRVLVIAVNEFRAQRPWSTIDQLPAKFSLPPPQLHARRTGDWNNLPVIIRISNGAASCDQRTQRPLSRNHGRSDIKDDGQDLRIERDAPTHAGS